MSEEKKKVNIEENIFKAGSFKLKNVTFEEVDMEMLVLDIEHLEDHIRMQPAAIAYYGALYKEACRRYDDVKKSWEYRWKELYSNAGAGYTGKKPTINDIEAKANADNETEVKEWQEKLLDLKKRVDMLEVFWEGWKQKSFAINNFVSIAMTDLVQKTSFGEDTTKSLNPDKVKKALEIIQKSK